VNQKVPRRVVRKKDKSVAAAENPSVILHEDLDALQEAVNRAVMGIRNPEVARSACEEIDRPREEKWRTLGNRNLATDLMRKSRDEA
jgi:hypothetical protein